MEHNIQKLISEKKSHKSVWVRSKNTNTCNVQNLKKSLLNMSGVCNVILICAMFKEKMLRAK